MGRHSRFRCEACGHEVVVSGGDDVGMACTTTTIVCLDCRALYDVITSDTPWKPALSKHKFRLECPEHAEHRCRKWGRGRKCPKCQDPMQQGEVEVLWD